MGKYLHLYDDVTAFTQDYNGEAYVEPWVSYTEENEHVDYNKRPSFLQTLWEVSGFTNPLPQKVILNYRYDDGTQYGDVNEPGLGRLDIDHYDNTDPFGFGSWSEIDEYISLGKYRVIDEANFTEADWNDPDCIGIYFLWEAADTENGWPVGWSDYPSEQGEGLYGTYREDGNWLLWGTYVLKCTKLNNVWYGYGIYGD